MSEFSPYRMCVVAGAAVVRENEILMVTNTYGAFKGVWSFPGGFVDANEHPHEAAVREAYEEAGVVATVEGLQGVLSLFINHQPALYLVYVCRHISGEPHPDGSENDRAAFFSLEALNTLKEPVDPQNKWLAEQILTNKDRALLPIDSTAWHKTYLITFG